jgi:rubrerythrin
MCSEANRRLIACVDISDISNKDIRILKDRGGQGVWRCRMCGDDL